MMSQTGKLPLTSYGSHTSGNFRAGKSDRSVKYKTTARQVRISTMLIAKKASGATPLQNERMTHAQCALTDCCQALTVQC